MDLGPSFQINSYVPNMDSKVKYKSEQFLVISMNSHISTSALACYLTPECNCIPD